MGHFFPSQSLNGTALIKKLRRNTFYGIPAQEMKGTEDKPYWMEITALKETFPPGAMARGL